jgi:hypothetical protein
MKQFIIAMGITLSSIGSMGQARDGTIDLKQTEVAQPAALIYLPYAPKVVELALSDYLSKISNSHQRGNDSFLLSESTLLVKNNISNADMYFEIGVKDNQHPNESVVYLKLNSFSRDLNDRATNTPVRFDMQQAKDYLDNLAVAIQPYAANMQVKLQQKNLVDAQKKSATLLRDGKALEQKRIALGQRKAYGRFYKNDLRLNKKTQAIEQAIKDNLVAQVLQNKEVAIQQAALTLLMDQNHH